MVDSTTWRDELLTELRKGPTMFVFRKSDGTDRVMKGTLRDDLLPPRDIITQDPERDPAKQKHNGTVQTVFDLDKQQWRSFRWDAVVGYYVNFGSGVVYVPLDGNTYEAGN